MKTKLNILRKKIDLIDLKMKELFLERMNLIKEVIEVKRSLNLEIEDKDREKNMLEHNSSSIEDETVKKLYQEFLCLNIELSKKYQKKKY